jgi:hypothetical protein
MKNEITDAMVKAAILASTTIARAHEQNSARWPDDYDEDERAVIIEMYRAALEAAEAARVVGASEWAAHKNGMRRAAEIADDIGAFIAAEAIRDEADAASPTAPVPAEEEGWRDIASAPKDGTRVFITNGEWVSEGWFSHSIWLGANAKDGGWVTDDERNDGFVYTNITYWQPFPALPTPPEGE